MRAEPNPDVDCCEGIRLDDAAPDQLNTGVSIAGCQRLRPVDQSIPAFLE